MHALSSRACLNMQGPRHMGADVLDLISSFPADHPSLWPSLSWMSAGSLAAGRAQLKKKAALARECGTIGSEIDVEEEVEKVGK